MIKGIDSETRRKIDDAKEENDKKKMVKAIKNVGILELEETFNSFPKQTVDNLKRELEEGVILSNE